jgi:hypothetical protein
VRHGKATMQPFMPALHACDSVESDNTRKFRRMRDLLSRAHVVLRCIGSGQGAQAVQARHTSRCA